MIFSFFGRLIFGDKSTDATEPPIEETNQGGHYFLKEQARLRREKALEIQRDDEEVLATIMAIMEFY